MPCLLARRNVTCRPLRLGLATAAAHAGQRGHEQDHHCAGANENGITSGSASNEYNIEHGNSQMKVRRMKKAPSSTGLALGRSCSLIHSLLRRPSTSSLASILVRQKWGGGLYKGKTGEGEGADRITNLSGLSGRYHINRVHLCV